MTKEVAPHSQPESLIVGHISNTVSEIQNESPIILHPRVIHHQHHRIEPIKLKYSPEVNLRTRSYFVFAIGLTFLIVFMNSALNTETSAIDAMDYLRLGNTLCFFSFAIAFFMNASYYKGKFDWKLSIGQSNQIFSFIGMIWEIILGILCSVIVIALINI